MSLRTTSQYRPFAALSLSGGLIGFALLLLLGGCSSPAEIDSYITFDLTRTATFALSAGSQQDTTISYTLPIDTTEYERNDCSASLLHSACVTVVTLTSSNASFPLDNITSAALTMASDTIGRAGGSAPLIYTLSDTLTTTGRDITPDVCAAHCPMTLALRLRSVPTTPVTLTATMTIRHIALHTPLIR